MKTEQGSLVLSLSLVLLIIALIASGVVGWLLWRDAGYSLPVLKQLVTMQSLPSPSTAVATPDALRPQVTIAPSLLAQAPEFEDQLVTPLRAYYATKPERLGTITVMAADKPTHTTKVSYELQAASGTTQHTFYYDRTGEDASGPYPRWSPSLLDITD